VLYIGGAARPSGGWRAKAAVLMVFSESGGHRALFYGGIVLFEKSEQVLHSLAVSPAAPADYAAAKLLSIG
jgi:fluoroquinolone transport system permease protein